MNGLNNFEEMVKTLRFWQKQYFKYKEPRALNEAKHYETQIDEYLKAKEEQYKQPELLTGENGGDNQ